MDTSKKIPPSLISKLEQVKLYMASISPLQRKVLTV